MFDQLLQLVKDHIGGNPQVAAAVPAEHADAVSHEIATHLQSGLKDQAAQGGAGNILSMLTGGGSGGSSITDAITGGLIGSLGSKFNLPPAATGAIAAALPGILQKFAHKTNDPNDNSITPSSLLSSLTGGKSGGLGGLF